ncbi:MAG: hypothetical protein R2685_10755 [Candidatus Nitrosocosmicus sp.]|nr:hypothetical protein [Candidatus Nitrosocosmicus sp.]
MSFNQQQKETVTDEIGIWTIGKDGRKYINLSKGTFFATDFKDKATKASTGQLEQVDDIEKQESHNAWGYTNGKTYSISQIKQDNGSVTNLVYEGPAKFPKKLIVSNNTGQTKIDTTNSGQVNKGYNNNWKGKSNNWTPKSIVVEDAGQDVKKLLFSDAVADTPLGGDRVMSLKPCGFDDNGQEVFLTYIPAVIKP